MVLIVFPLVLLSHIRVADTSNRLMGPVWLRRAQWAFIGGILLLSILMLRVFEARRAPERRKARDWGCCTKPAEAGFVTSGVV